MAIETRTDLENWLKGKPLEWGVALAARAAARVLPAAASDIKSLMFLERWQDTAVLPILRALFMSAVAGKYPTAEIMLAAAAAAKTADAVASTDTAYATEYATTAAAYSSYAAADPAATAAKVIAAATAAKAAAAARATAAGVYAAIDADSRRLVTGPAFKGERLWPKGSPAWVRIGWAELRTELLRTGDHWQVWIDWYEDLLAGETHSASVGRPEILERSLEIAAIPDEDWKRGSEHVNAMIAAINAKYWGGATFRPATVGEIEAVASPLATLNSENVLDLQANPIVDKLDSSPDVATIPETQIVLIGVMLEGLPGNAPKGLLSALVAYRAEVERRKLRPILGTLTTLHSIAMAERQGNDADIWLPPGMKTAFQKFDQHHEDFVSHYPMLEKREDVISRIAVDETKTRGEDLIAPFRQALQLAKEATEAGVATEDVLKYFEHLKQAADAIAHLAEDMEISPTSNGDRILPAGATAKQRLLGSAIGYLERAYNLTGTTVTVGTASYPALAENIGRVLRHLKDMAGL